MPDRARGEKGGTHMDNGCWKGRRYPLDCRTLRGLTRDPLEIAGPYVSITQNDVH